MSRTIDIGGMRVTAVNDGVVRLPPMYYPGLDFDAHPELLQADGTYHIPVGCFLIQGEGFTVLVDAGLGPSRVPFPEDTAAAAGLTHPPAMIAEGGRLPDALAEAGVAPEDVTTVFLTHLHADHIGWVAPEFRPFFPNATVMCSAMDWTTTPTAPAPGEMEGRARLRAAETAGVLRTVDAPTVRLAPGVVAHHNPGHTPGHYVVSATSGDESVHLLGDAVHHPLQLNDKNIAFVSEERPDLALRAREQLLEALQGRSASIGMAHFPGLDFQRIITRDGREWTTEIQPNVS